MEYEVLMSLTLEEFLQSKGGVGLLSVLQERGKTYSEIEPEVDMTSSTISQRLDDALELGLIEMKPAKHEGRTLTEYHLTGFGEDVAREMGMRGMVSNYRDMRTHQRALERQTDEFLDWLRQKPRRFLGHEEVHDETLITRDAEVEPEDESNSNEASRPRVIRPTGPRNKTQDSESDDLETDLESADANTADEAQRRLSDQDVQERMRASAAESEDDVAEDDSPSEDREDGG